MVSTQSFGVESGLKYLSESQQALQTRSPNQELLPLTASVNSSDRLEIGGCEVTALVEQFGSPLYILDEETLRAACTQYRDAFSVTIRANLKCSMLLKLGVVWQFARSQLRKV